MEIVFELIIPCLSFPPWFLSCSVIICRDACCCCCCWVLTGDSIVRRSKDQVPDRVYVLAGEAGREIMLEKGHISTVRKPDEGPPPWHADPSSGAATTGPAVSATAAAAAAATAVDAAAVASESESKQQQQPPPMTENPLVATGQKPEPEQEPTRVHAQLSEITKDVATAAPSPGPANQPTPVAGSVESGGPVAAQQDVTAGLPATGSGHQNDQGNQDEDSSEVSSISQRSSFATPQGQ